MKIRKAVLPGVAGLVAAAGFSGAINAQTTVTMGVSMSIASLATTSSTALDFGTVAANPSGGNVVLGATTNSTGTLSGTGVLGTGNSATLGTIGFNRSVSIKALLTAPGSPITMSCPGGVISVGNFLTASSSTFDCNTAGTGACGYNIGATASLPAGLSTGSCTAGSASFTVTYQ